MLTKKYYNPVVGRFVSADTKQGNAQGMDPYSYVGNNPETLNDPTGQRFCNPTATKCGDPCADNCSPGDGGCSAHWQPPMAPCGGSGSGGGNGGGAPTPTPHKKPPAKSCQSTCLANGSRWLNFLSRAILLIGGGAALGQVIGDLIKWIGIGISSLIAQGWAQLVDAILHVGRDVLSAIDMIGSVLGVLPDSWKGVIRPIEAILDFVTPIMDVAGFALGLLSAPLQSIARRIFDNNPVINLMANWGSRAIVTYAIKWTLGQNAPWLEQGMAVVLTGVVSPAQFCGLISTACENTPPSWVQ